MDCGAFVVEALCARGVRFCGGGAGRLWDDRIDEGVADALQRHLQALALSTMI